VQEADPRVIKLVQQLDQERSARKRAERRATALRSVLTRLKAKRTADAKPQREQRSP
jgi:hypothetical protein